MAIIGDRTSLDNSLNDTTTTIFILVGSAGSKADAVHTKMLSKDWEEFQKFYLIPAATLLTPAELSKWFNGNTSEFYVVLGGADIPKVIAQQGPITDLLKTDGTPDYLAIREKFLSGDLL